MITLALVLTLAPYVYRSLDSRAGDLEGDGPGDVTLSGKYRLFRYTYERASDHAAIIVHAVPEISGTEVRPASGRKFQHRGAAPEKVEGRRRMNVLDWRTTEKTAVQFLD